MLVELPRRERRRLQEQSELSSANPIAWLQIWHADEDEDAGMPAAEHLQPHFTPRPLSMLAASKCLITLSTLNCKGSTGEKLPLATVLLLPMTASLP